MLLYIINRVIVAVSNNHRVLVVVVRWPLLLFLTKETKTNFNKILLEITIISKQISSHLHSNNNNNNNNNNKTSNSSKMEYKIIISQIN